jgi:hypothetical protein
VTTVQEKLNAFADTLQQIFTINPDVHRIFTVTSEQVVNNFLKTPLKEPLQRDIKINSNLTQQNLGSASYVQASCAQNNCPQALRMLR